MSGFFNSLKSLASGAANAANYQEDEEDDEGEDTRMRFSLMPQPGESGFTQWLDAMKMVASLPGGIPQEFRRRLWLTLAERHLEQRGVDWKQAEKLCFNEWSNPDDEELGIQIVKDLHRTGCSLFCGAAGRDNQAVLRRVLLGFARWNKSVGYCQGLNVLAALVLQVTDRAESSAVKVMIYLIEGVLPEGYFADNLRGLSVDMAVFRDLLKMRLPKLSKHLEALQSDAKDKATGSSYEPPLTNVFTMQWFLTLFCHCLPQDTVLRVWDLIFLEGDEVLLRTALAIWEGISDRVMTVTSADEFYSIMGVLTREMLEFTDTNNLIKTIVNMGPLHGVTDLREKHRYNITPWARRLSDDEDTDTEEEEKLAVAAAVFGVQHRLKKGYKKGTSIAAGTLQAINQGGDKERLALDISTLKHQYAKLRERQRQAHIILSAACARQSMVPPTTSQAMNHLLVGKSALVSAKTRQLGPPPGAIPPKPRLTSLKNPRSQMRKDKQGTTLHWKDTKKSRETKNEPAVTTDDVDTDSVVSSDEIAIISHKSSRRSSADSDSDSTSTELCDDPERLSDSEDLTSASDCYVMASDDERSPLPGGSPRRSSITKEIDSIRRFDLENVETNASIARITDQIRRLSAGDDNNSIVLPVTTASSINKKDSSQIEEIQLNNEVKNEPSVPVDSDDFIHRNDKELDKVVKLHDKYSSMISEDMLSARKSPSAEMEDKSNIDDIFKKDDLGLGYLSKSVDLSGDFGTISKVPMETSKLSEDNFAMKNYYDKSYVIGHLPISPITVDHKLAITGIVSNITTSLNQDSKLTTTSPNSKDSHLSLNYHQNFKLYEEMKKSPKTPESGKSFSSGETMGPDSKVSSITTSPRTPVRLDSGNFRSDKSHSSASSDDKTLTMQSVDSEIAQSASKIQSKCSFDNLSPSTTMSIDSLKNKSETSPNNIIISSSGESYCPERVKSTEISFSSELNSSTSANSIKYTSTYKNQENLSADISDMKATSPFYPISNADQKFTSPTIIAKEIKMDRAEFDKRELVESSLLMSDISLRSSKLSQPKIDDYDSGRPFEVVLEATLASRNDKNSSPIGVHQREHKFEKLKRFLNNEDLDDHFENDTVSPLPRDKFTSLKLSLDTSSTDLSNNSNVKISPSKLFERSSSVIDKKLNDMKLSTSTEDFAGTKKRSSDILDDLRHMEATVLETNISSDVNMTRKTGYDWEDLKNLEARRQDTFSDSASGFSQARLDLPGITVSNEVRKTYVVEPKMQIDETSDSILKNYTKQKENGEPDRESKLGVWTKVKPRKKGENGRRSSSDRALKIIQENSAILHKILTCQAKKRLPDLEEISKEITISPINEEISKIFSPILEKMGLNEHEINEELARINFKEFDQIKATNGSEFDAKIHDELSKLSIIDDNEEINPLDVDEMISDDYLNTREALIDKQINEELSKLLANYDQSPPIDIDHFDKGSSSQNEIEGLDLTSISTNVFSYKSSNDSIEMKSDFSSIHDSVEKFHHYSDNVPLPYSSTSSKYDIQNLSPRSDIDIYRELDKLNKISSGQVLPAPLERETSAHSPGAYGNNLPSYETLPSLDYMKPEKPFENSALKSPYDSYKPYDFQQNISKISPTQISKLKTTNIRSYDNNSSSHDLEFGLETSARSGLHNYEINKRQMLSKETLEFRVRYEEDNVPSEQSLSGYRATYPELESYYTREEPINRATLPSVLSPLDYHQSIDQTDAAYSTKYLTKSPEKYFTINNSDYERKSYKLSPLSDDIEIGAYQVYHPPNQRKDPHPPLSPSNYQFEERSFDRLCSYNSKLDTEQIKKSRIQLNDDIGSSLKFTDATSRDSIAYRKASMTLGPLDNVSRVSGSGYESGVSPKSQFNPFPVRNTTRKPKELALKLGLYSPSSPGKTS